MYSNINKCSVFQDDTYVIKINRLYNNNNIWYIRGEDVFCRCRVNRIRKLNCRLIVPRKVLEY